MGQQRDAVVTKVSAADLFDALRAAWRALLNEDAPRSALVLLVAQWALETGYGAHCMNWNLGNAKARPGGAADWTYFSCDERLTPAAATHAVAIDPAHARIESAQPGADGLVPVWFDPPNASAAFAAYTSLADGAHAWLALQHGRFAGAWGALLSGSGRLFAGALHDEGYFTAQVDRYATTLTAVAATLDKELPDFTAEDAGDPTSQGHDTEPAPASGTAA